MCGIAGYVLKQGAENYSTELEKALLQLAKRGPDAQNTFYSGTVGLGHVRLSIIDTSQAANQPMSDKSGRYTIIFNGEIFNFKELKQQYLSHIQFATTSDTEVLLYLFIEKGKDCLPLLNGFFAFAVYDNLLQVTFIARDRFGIKPLVIFEDDKRFLFASEMKALLAFPIKKEIDFSVLHYYLQLNYVPLETSMLKGFRKLKPGTFLVLKKDGTKQEGVFYKVQKKWQAKQYPTYEKAQAELREIVEAAVQRRLVSDVPLGAFLSGGIDSSIVVSCAAKHTKHLNTFSIGFKDEPYFDETYYANLVAKQYQTNHTVFKISTDEMLGSIDDLLNYIDEPFADSSAIAVNILCKYTRQKATVALSGDGGDELFAGYNKHAAAWQASQKNTVNFILKNALPILSMLPASRHGKVTNLFRQLQRYSIGLNLPDGERYWRWCAYSDAADVNELLLNPVQNNNAVISELASIISAESDMNNMLLADVRMVLANDMLVKVDLMSMANSLEVRTPLLDYTVVDYAFSLPFDYKLRNKTGKSILKDAFRNQLPAELFTRTKRGFEVPLLKWFRTALHEKIENYYLSDNFVEAQGIFNPKKVKELKRQLFSANPGDVHAKIWALVVFQHWYKKYFEA
ncbi:MAG: asparagine synthase (glutamine-hydrolyzing) [Bacteroidetes bacterium 37-13]|nr:MAG: asparagine synthase (glutamine-hydrolyzing) [Bacteroidetes bacterium 37-13]